MRLRLQTSGFRIPHKIHPVCRLVVTQRSLTKRNIFFVALSQAGTGQPQTENGSIHGETQHCLALPSGTRSSSCRPAGAMSSQEVAVRISMMRRSRWSVSPNISALTGRNPSDHVDYCRRCHGVSEFRLPRPQDTTITTFRISVSVAASRPG